MGLLSTIFGDGGSAAVYFGGSWAIVGLFLIFILSTYFFARGFTAEAMGLFLFSAIILVTLDGVFAIPSDWIIIMLIFIMIIFGMALKNFVTR